MKLEETKRYNHKDVGGSYLDPKEYMDVSPSYDRVLGWIWDGYLIVLTCNQMNEKKNITKTQVVLIKNQKRT